MVLKIFFFFRIFSKFKIGGDMGNWIFIEMVCFSYLFGVMVIMLINLIYFGKKYF